MHETYTHKSGTWNISIYALFEHCIIKMLSDEARAFGIWDNKVDILCSIVCGDFNTNYKPWTVYM